MPNRSLAVLFVAAALAARADERPLERTWERSRPGTVSRGSARHLTAVLRSHEAALTATCSAASATAILNAIANPACSTIDIAAGTYQLNATIDRNVTLVGQNFTTTKILPLTVGTPIFTIEATFTEPVDPEAEIPAESTGVVFRNLTLMQGSAPSGGAILNEGAYVTIDNCVLTGNKATGSLPGSGGAIDNDGYGLLVIQNSRLTGNDAAVSGGAISNGKILSPSVVVIRDSRLDDNVADLSGGAIHNDIGFLFIFDSEIDNNRIDASLGCFGGAISNVIGVTRLERVHFHHNKVIATTYVAAGAAISTIGNLVDDGAGAVIAKDCLFEDNESKAFLLSSGGAVAVLPTGTFQAERCTFRRNRSGGGGAIDVQMAAHVTLDDCNITRNKVEGTIAAFGAGIKNDRGDITIRRSTISYNEAVGFGLGGGLYNNADGGLVEEELSDEAIVLIENSTISGNVAHNLGTFGGGGGAIYNSGSGVLGVARVTLKNVTIANNEAKLRASAIFSNSDPQADVEVIASNSIIHTTDNPSVFAAGDYNCDTFGDGKITSAGYNVVSDDTCNFNNFDVEDTDPLLTALADWGGLTPTHALSLSSPAINVGNPAPPTAEGDSNSCFDADQRETTRPQDGRCDAGAYEFAFFHLIQSLVPQGFVIVAGADQIEQTYTRAPVNADGDGIIVQSRFQGRIPLSPAEANLVSPNVWTITKEMQTTPYIGDNMRVSVTRGLKNSDDVELQNPTQYAFTTRGDNTCVGFFTNSDNFSSGSLPRALAWGDYDKDGDLDVAVSGSVNSEIYRYNGSNFVSINSGLPDLTNAAVAWGDFDNDFDLDLAIAGRESGTRLTTEIYRNTAGVFTAVDAGIAGVEYGSLDWGDYDNDGDLDLLVTGQYDFNQRVSDIWINEGEGSFRRARIDLPGIYRGDAKFGDFDLDGDLDIAIAGAVGVEGVAEVYRNDRSDIFTAMEIGGVGLKHASVAWGDADGDGDLDLAMIGETSQGAAKSSFYGRTSSGFTYFDNLFTKATKGTVAFGDYDGDNDLDLVVTGLSGGAPFTDIFRNNGSFNFAAMSAGIRNYERSSAAWGDFNKDGRLDLMVGGWDGTNWSNRVFRNDACAVTNDAYTMPSGGVLTVAAPGVLSNDKHVGPATVAVVTDVATGTLVLGANGGFTYTPPSGFNGTVTFTYNRVVNGLVSGTPTVTITVQPVGECRTTIDGVTVYASADAGAVQAAIDAASSGATIKVAGTCAGTSLNGGTTQLALVNKSVTLRGGHSPADFAFDPDQYLTLLDAQFGGRVLTITGGSTEATLEHLGIINGLAAGGGGVLHTANRLTVTECEFAGNESTANGGAIRATANMTMTDTYIVSSAAVNGAGLSIEGGTATLQRNTFEADVATTNGGAIYITSGTANLTNCTLAGNRATEGGGIYVGGGTVNTNNVTIDGSTNWGLFNNGGTVNIANTLLSNAPNCSGTITSKGYNLATDTSCSIAGTGDQSGSAAIPLVLPVAENGGPTKTAAIAQGSTAANAGAPSSHTTPCAATDQRGETRPSPCDIGAFELPSFAACKAYVVSTGSVYPTSTPTNVNDGQPVRDAITAASAGDTIRLAGYCIAPDTSTFLTIGKLLTFEGGYDGTNWAADAYDQQSYPTTLDGSGNVRIADISTTSNTAIVFKRITFTRGDDDDTEDDSGGAIKASGQTLTVTDCDFVANTADADNGFGGAIYYGNTTGSARTLTFTNVRFSDNSAGDHGGAIYLLTFSGTTLHCTNCTFEENTAFKGGGVLWTESGGTAVANFTSSTFTRNSASGATLGGGGAIATDDVTLNVSSSTFLENTSEAGGAIHVDDAGGTATITDSTFIGNMVTPLTGVSSKRREGGAIYSEGPMIIERSLLYKNQGRNGSAIWQESGGTLTLRNSTVSTNSGTITTSSIIDTTRPATITSSTIANNVPGSSGGALDTTGASGAVTITNTIFSGNTKNCLVTTQITSGGFNLLDDTSCSLALGTDNQSGDANLASLDLTDELPTHALLPGSDGIDTGTCASLTVDQRGQARPAGDACDIGAFERQGSASATELTTSDSTTVFGESVTFTVEVSGASAIPTGSVELRDGATVLTTLILDGSGSATYTTAALSVGGSPHTITASYLGDAEFDSSEDSVTQTVSQGATITSISGVSAAPSEIDEPITVTAGVVADTPSTGTPTGQIVVADTTDAGDACTITLPDTTCQLTLTNAGTRYLTATYSGSTQYATSTSGELEQEVVVPTPPVPTVATSTSGDPNPLTSGETVPGPVNPLLVTFSDSMYDAESSSESGDVTNTANYYLVNANGNGFQTTSCGTLGGNDTAITISVVNYVEGTKTATVAVNDGSVLPSGSYRFFVCSTLVDIELEALDGNGDRTGGDAFSIDFTVESAPPTITTVNSVADTGNASISENEITNVAVTKLLVTFSEDVRTGGGSDDADTVANYSLVRGGTNNTVDTTSCGTPASDDVAVTINSINFASNVATLSVNGGSALSDAKYRLFVCSSILDLAGNAIDGDANGTGGDAFSRSFQVNTTGQIQPAIVSNTHEPGNYSKTTPIVVTWSGGVDPIGIAGYSVLFDSNATTTPDTTVDVAEVSTHTASSGALADGVYWFHLRMCNVSPACGPAVHFGPITIDNVPPVDPPQGNVTSTTHTIGTFSKQKQITVKWTGATDNHVVFGYSVLFDTSTTTLPDTSIDVLHGPDPQSATSGLLADGVDHYFHLRTCDAALNCTSTVHLGPFSIDATAPVLGTLTSPSHAVNVLSLLPVVTANWTAASDPLSGLAGYQLTFIQSATPPLSPTASIAANATTGDSDPLAAGTWYIHLSAIDNAGNVSNAIYGPVLISNGAIPASSGLTLILLGLALTAVALFAMRRC